MVSINMADGKKHSVIKKLLQNSTESIFQKNGKPVYPSHSFWEYLSQKLYNDHQIRITKKTLYNYVLQNKYDISPPKFDSQIVASEHESEEFISEEEDSDEIANLEFKIVVSAEEWMSIKPINKIYGKHSKSYEVLKPMEWTNIFASHFWDMTKLPCPVSFKRAQVYSSNSADQYIKIEGSCKECESKLECTARYRRDYDGRMIFDTTYKGPFRNICHTKKRFLNGRFRQEVVSEIIKSHNLPSNYRNDSATNIMNPGDQEPASLPSASVIRQAVYEQKNRMRMDKNEIWSVFNLKFSNPYNLYIKDIGIDRFFLHYWSSVQLHVYNEYNKNPFSKIAIDATGGIVKKIKRPDNSLSGAIFLYDIAVRDPFSKTQYSVCNMLSERHDADSIAYWLNNWKRDGAATPTEIVCDMSLALLSGVAKSFGESYNITEYVNNLYNLLIHGTSRKPPTFIRCDVAHVVKLLVQLKSLQNQRSRTKQFYVRSLTKVLLCSNVTDLENILYAIFVVSLSETEGLDNLGNATLAQQKKQFLKDLIAEGSESTEERIILDTVSMEDEVNTTDAEFLEIDECESRFKTWAEHILDRAKVAIGEERDGDHDNMQYLPEIIKPIVNLCKLLPLWTAVMTPILKNSGTVCSSASVESNFHNIKNRIFHNFQLPIRVDDMIKRHIDSLEGIMRIAISSKISSNITALDVTLKKQADVPIYNVTKNSELSRSSEKLSLEEKMSVENWRGEGIVKKNRPRKSYLEPQKEWAFINLADKSQIIPIGFLRNANASDLKPIKIDNWKYIITNTCAIDCLLQILCTAYCDSSEFNSKIENWCEVERTTTDNFLLRILQKLVTGKISAQVYELRGKIVKEFHGEELLPNKLKLISCITTLVELLHNLMKENFLPWCKTTEVLCTVCKSKELIKTASIPVNKMCDFETNPHFSLVEKKLFCSECKSNSKEINCKLNDFLIFLEWTDEKGYDIKCKLSDIPNDIHIQEKTYCLRGVIEIIGGEKNSVGHFVAFAKRLRGKWEKYDDLKKKAERRIDEDHYVSTTLLIYSV